MRRASRARSRAVVHWSGSGRPDALVKVVLLMPSARARNVIIWANRSSVPPSSSASAAAASLADLVIRPRMACSTHSRLAGTSPSLVGAIEAEWPETGTGVSSPIRRSRSASNTIYSVMTLVRLAGWRGASALAASITCPLPASTTMEL